MSPDRQAAANLPDAVLQWLASATVQNDSVQMVRCADCRHCDANPHTPAQGWCGCALRRQRDHGWPAARRVCRRFQAEGQADA